MISFYVYFALILTTTVNGKSAVTSNHKVYKPINKENIRNSFNTVNEYSDDVTSEEIQALVKNISETLLPNFIKITLSDGYLQLSVNLPKENVESIGRKLSSKMDNMMQYMIAPGFLMAGILPWVMPKLQMAVMMVSMVNNMIFSSALFSLVRSYIFEQQPDEHIIYVNHGYRNNHPPQYHADHKT